MAFIQHDVANGHIGPPQILPSVHLLCLSKDTFPVFLRPPSMSVRISLLASRLRIYPQPVEKLCKVGPNLNKEFFILEFLGQSLTPLVVGEGLCVVTTRPVHVTDPVECIGVRDFTCSHTF